MDTEDYAGGTLFSLWVKQHTFFVGKPRREEKHLALKVLLASIQGTLLDLEHCDVVAQTRGLGLELIKHSRVHGGLLVDDGNARTHAACASEHDANILAQAVAVGRTYYW
jgi:hypothetical protein